MVSILSTFFYYRIHSCPESCLRSFVLYYSFPVSSIYLGVLFLSRVYDLQICIIHRFCLRSSFMYYSSSMSSILELVLFRPFVFDQRPCFTQMMCLRSSYLSLSLFFFLRSCLSLLRSRSSSSVPKRSSSGLPTRY